MTNPEQEQSTDYQVVNRAEHEMTENLRGETLPKAVYVNVGTFKEVLEPILLGSEAVKRKKLLTAWTGTISTENRPQLTTDLKERMLAPDNLNKYYVRCTERSRVRCIDGRCIECFGERNDTAADRELGPQTPGGTVTGALCDRVASWGTVYTENFSLVDDVHRRSLLLEEKGYVIGGHIDDHSPEDMTGCGAIDRVPEILEKVTNPVAQRQVRQLLKMMLGDVYDQDVVDALSGRLLSLQGMADEYFGKDEEDNYPYRKDAIEKLREDNPRGVEKLLGKHNEIALVLNFVKDTTFHRDQFSTDNNHEIQIFNYDFWYSQEIADVLYPAEGDKATIENNAKLRVRFLTVRAMLAVGTCMVLTDGSLDLIVRQEEKS